MIADEPNIDRLPDTVEVMLRTSLVSQCVEGIMRTEKKLLTVLNA